MAQIMMLSGIVMMANRAELATVLNEITLSTAACE